MHPLFPIKKKKSNKSLKPGDKGINMAIAGNK